MYVQIEKEIRSFIEYYVECFTCLDLLIFFSNNPNVREKSTGIAQLIGRNEDDVRQALNFLTEKGILVKEKLTSDSNGNGSPREKTKEKDVLYFYNPSQNLKERVKRFVDCMSVREKRLLVLTALLKKGIKH